MGACSLAPQPVYGLIERHVLGTERLRGDDSPWPTKGQMVKVAHLHPYPRRAGRSRGTGTAGGALLRLAGSTVEHPAGHHRGFINVPYVDAYFAYSCYNALNDLARLVSVAKRMIAFKIAGFSQFS